ncbi:MAG: hypothetical protein IJ365_04115 [Clostridia bacterium]|nr:hypothetical protein [Clostridia bacterium]
MKKKNFITLVLGVIGGLMFAIGMCMCLLPEWNAFKPGVVFASLGFVALLILFVVRFKMDGRQFVAPNWKTVGIVAYAAIATLLFGTGMCMIMVWSMYVFGMLAGVAGILLLLGLIPMVKGLK